MHSKPYTGGDNAFFKLNPWHLSIVAALSLPMAASAQQATGRTDAELQDVVVTATRTAKAADTVPGTVTTVDKAEIERRQAHDIADVFRDEPDVAISSDPRRFGTGGINIRGIEDNRVLLLIDGVRATDYRAPGTTNYDGSTRDLPDPDFLKQVEIVRGPASSLYGSDAIGGVVGFLTLDPEDFLKDGKTQAMGTKLSYFSENQGKKGTGWVAGGNDVLKSLLMVSRYDAKETETMGSNNVYGFARTTANPQNSSTLSMLGKLVLNPAVGHELRLGLEWKDRQANTDVQRLANMSATSPTSLSRITQNLGDDSLERQRLTLDYIHTPGAGWYDRAAFKAYWQQQETYDKNYQRRSNASLNATWGCSSSTAGSGNCDVNQSDDFKQSLLGASLVMDKAIHGALPQSLTWGADLLRTTTQEVKNTSWTNLATGVSSNLFLGESFPKSEYPKGHMDQAGLFAQDDLFFAEGRVQITPGLRYDYFQLEPEGDSLYRPVAGASAVAKNGNRLSPKLGASFEIVPQTQVYAQYVEGYRAPSYEQVNRYFLNTQSYYGIVGNPNLKPETSKGLELGLKAGNKELGGQVAAYSNRYENFIDYVKLAAGDPASLPAPYTSTYQYRNLQNASIHGYELRGHWQAMQTLKLTASYAYAWGQYESATAPGTYLPLNSVEPRRVSLSAVWEPNSVWGAETRLRAAGKQNRVDDSSGALFRPGGYAVLDLSGWWQIEKNTRLNLALNNAFDRKYWLWSDVRRAVLPASDPGTDFYTQPGRNFAVSLKVDF